MKLTKVNYQLPVKLEELVQFVLVGRERLEIVRHQIRAMDNLNIAFGVKEQKKQEAQDLAEALMDAEARIGEIMLNIPKTNVNKQRIDTGVISSSKEETIKELGFNMKQVSRFQTLAENKDIIEEVKEEARKNDDLPTRSAVLKKVREREKDKKKKEYLAKRENAVININGKQLKKADIRLTKGWYKVGKQFLYYGSNTDKDFIDHLPNSSFAFADPPYNAGVDEWDHDFKWELDYLQEKADVVAVTPGGWNAFNFYKETNMNYLWEMFCWIENGMTHGRCGYANVIKTSIFSTQKVKIKQDFWKISIKNNETVDTQHRGRKPYDFMYHLLHLFTNENDFVIDPFAGSGTTLLLSEKLNRISYNAEINENYCIDIINRIGEYVKC